MTTPLVTPPGEADLFDYALLEDYLRFVAGSISRHRYFIGLSSIAFVLVTAALLSTLPKTYHAETRILALKNTLLPKTVDPGWPEAEDPTRAAREAILSRDNLVALVRQTDLVNRYPLSRAPLLKLKDKITGAVSEEDQLAALVGTLEARLDVQVSPGAVTIALDWPDAGMAYQLVDAAWRNFLEQRRLADLTPFSEAIGILEARAVRVREEIAFGVERVEAAREAVGKKRPVRKPERQPDAKERAVAELAQSHRRRLDDLQSQLKEAQKTYAGGHPIVLDLQQSIAALQAQSDVPEKLTRRLPTTARQLASATTAEFEDAPIEQAKEDLRFALSKYAGLLDRIDGAQMRLQSAQADFKHRFSVVKPAELPRAPVKPKPPAILIGSLIGGLLLAVLLAALRDVRYGVVFERWQVLRQLGIPVLGEVHQ